MIGTDSLGRRCLGQTEFVAAKPAYSHYASLIQERVEARGTCAEQNSRSAGRKRRRPTGAASKSRAGTPKELKRFNKYSVEQLEELITAHEQDLAEMKERFGDATIYKNPEQLAELQRDFDAATAELDLLYRAYERRVG